MSRFTFSPRELAARLRRDDVMVPNAVSKGMRLGAARGRTRLVRATPVDLGQMKNAWREKDTGDGVDVVNDAPHAGIVERGARPHAVSEEGIQALAEWARRNLHIEERRQVRQQARALRAGGDRAGAAVWSKAGNDFLDQEALKVAHAIAWKLRHQGQEPKFIVASRLDLLRRDVRREVERILRRYTDTGEI